MTAWIRQSSDSPTVDDPAISDDEVFIRICKNPSQIAYDKATSTYVFSDQLFSALGPGCSIEFVSSFAPQANEHRVALSPSGAGHVQLAVGAVRKVPRADKEATMLGVAYTPLSAAEQGGPNEHHGDIFPPASGGAYKKLRKLCLSLVVQDQTLAAQLYLQSRGRPPL